MNFGFFEKMLLEERMVWMFNNSIDKDVYLSDMNCSLRFVKLDANFTTLPFECQQKLMSGEWLTMNEVYNMFLRKPGSKAARHSLIFRGSNWKLINYGNITCNFYFSLLNFNMTKEPSSNTTIVDYNDFTGNIYKIGVTDDKECLESDIEVYKDKFVESKIKWFSPSIHKSLIQKCIRVRPKFVIFDNIEIPTERVLITSFLMLLYDPGAFVPALQKFVKGSESAFKRLAISLIEDSTCSLQTMYTLFFAALAARSGYKPSLKFVNLCCQWIVNGLSSNYFVYDFYVVRNIPVGDYEKLTINLIKNLKSFETDINMVISVMENNLSILESKYEQPNSMKIEHCLDHHSITEIAYFYNYNITNTKTVFSDIFSAIWSLATGLNSRKKEFKPDIEVALAQKRLWIAKSSVKSERNITSDTITCNRNIDLSWITGIIGQMENTVNGTPVLSFFHPDMISSIITIRRPSRDNKNDIDDNIKKEASLLCEYQKSNWFNLKEPLLNMDMNFVFNSGCFYCQFEGKIVRWEDYCNSSYSIPLIQDELLELNLDNIVTCAYNYSSIGIEKNSLDKISNILRYCQREVLSRLAMYLKSSSKEIEIYKISRDGSSTYLSVDWTDIYVFRVLLSFCCIIPSIITTDSSLKFKILFFPFWNDVKKLVFKMIDEEILHKWTIKFDDKRTLQKHQNDSVIQMMERFDNGKKGNLLYLDVGLGKTLITTTVLGRMIDSNRMPTYCIYTLPPSAISSICKELSYGNLPYNLIEGTKGGNRNFYSNCINLIKHDHLRLLHDELISIAPSTFFIIDEFHLLLDNTKRTSTGLEIVKLCKNFIGMSGTIIKNNRIEGSNLIQWLQQIVDFDVNIHNYMAGVAGLVSYRIKLNIEEKRNNIQLDINNEEYYNIVSSKFGGKAVETDFIKAVNICYEIIYHGLINRVLTYLQNGYGPVFLVARNKEMQSRLFQDLSSRGILCFNITGDNSINLTSEELDRSQNKIQVIITTIRHSTGYTITACKVMITAPYFTNEATREQLEGRILRISQKSPFVIFEILHCGILSYILNNHEDARALSKALRDLSKEI